MTQQTDAFSVIVLWSIGANLNYDELVDLKNAWTFSFNTIYL